MATIYDIMNSNTGRMTQKMGGTPISTPTMNPTNINYGTVLTDAQTGIKPTTTKTKENKKDINKTIKTVLSGNIPGGVLPKKSLFEKFYDEYKKNSSKKPNIYDFFENAKEFGDAIKKGFNEDVLGKEEITDIANSYPEMAGVFADYVKKSGVGVKPLVTPIDTTPASVPAVTSKITTPGLEPTSSALIEAQGAIKPEVKPVKVDVTEGKPAEEKADEITGGKKDITKDESDKIKTDLDNQEAEALDKATTPEQKNDIMKYFNKLQNEITKRTISQLKAGKEQALISLGQAQAALAPQYESQRARAATQSMQQARNFGEYLAARGQSTSGLAAQAELTRGAGLTRQLGEIGQQQQSAQDQLNANKAKIQSDFQLAIANAKSDAEIARLNEAFRQAVKQEDRAYNEKITADNRAYAAKLLAEDKEYQDMLFKRNRAIELGDRAAAQEYEKQMIDYKAQVEIGVARQRAALEPEPATSTKYYDIPGFTNTLQQLQTGDTQANYNDLITNASEYISAFGYDGYQELKKELEKIVFRAPLQSNQF